MSEDGPARGTEPASTADLGPSHSPSMTTLQAQHLATSGLHSTRRLDLSYSPLPTLPNPSHGPEDRVFPTSSVVNVNRMSTPATHSFRYGSTASVTSAHLTERGYQAVSDLQSGDSAGNADGSRTEQDKPGYRSLPGDSSLQSQEFDQITPDPGNLDSSSVELAVTISGKDASRTASEPDDSLTTTKFTYVVTADGHAVITGRDGTIQRCEDEPIHIPGAIQGFGLLVVLQEIDNGNLIVRIASENSLKMIGYSPKHLFGLESFVDILSEEQAENLTDHIDFVRDEDTDVEGNGPDVFTLSILDPRGESRKFWCALHINQTHSDLLICEFEFENDLVNPHAAHDESTPEIPEDTLDSNPSAEEWLESTSNMSKPLRVLRRARKSQGEAAAMEVFNILSQIQTQLAEAPSLDIFLKVLVGVVKELTGFHRVMIYQFDKDFNGTVVTELVDPRATKDLYKGLHFPASDIPKQARDLYKRNRVRLLYDRDHETAKLVCRTPEDLNTPLDLTHSYLRAMSPIHLKYLANMAVRASMSISINAFDELWGLISCHAYGQRGMRVSFPLRRMCRLIGDTASRSIERLSYASRIYARKLINTIPTKQNPSGYITATSEDLLKLFNADFGMLSIQGEATMLGTIENIQEVLAMLQYLKVCKISSITSSQDITGDFPDLNFEPGFQVLAGMLLVPLSHTGADFIVFFRKSQLKEVKWAGNPYEKVIKQGTEAYLEPRQSFRLWSEIVVGTCREWTEAEIETAAVLYLVYGKFIEVWRQKEAALESSQITKLLLANSAHEVRTPLNAIINYLEIAMEGSLDEETRECLAKSHSASKSLIYVINDLLDLAKIEEGVNLRRADIMDLQQTFQEATNAFHGDAKRKGIGYTVTQHPGVPKRVLGDQRTVRQSMTNLIANAITNTTEGGVTVETYVALIDNGISYVEVAVQDTGIGMSAKKMDALLVSLEQVQTNQHNSPGQPQITAEPPQSTLTDEDSTVGLGLAIVARIVRNMNGQLRLKSEEGRGSRFVIQYPFELVESEERGSVSPTSEDRRLLSSKAAESEVLLVDRHKHRLSSTRTSRRPSTESQKSQAGRLIEAIHDPIRPIQAPDAPAALVSGAKSIAGTAGSVLDSQHTKGAQLLADNLNILVAEDDPINSKILQKRLERSGHTVHLTGNGAECASAYSDTERLFDVVLMDIQMPIMDGLASTKKVREIETSNAAPELSQRASLNGRVPIIAVSASLAEREREKCINAGFDAWLLKPISFPRLNEVLGGIVDEEMRKNALYAPGKWDLGGWFDVARPVAAGTTVVAGQSSVIRPSSESRSLRGAPGRDSKDGSTLELITQDVPAASPGAVE